MKQTGYLPVSCHRAVDRYGTLGVSSCGRTGWLMAAEDGRTGSSGGRQLAAAGRPLGRAAARNPQLQRPGAAVRARPAPARIAQISPGLRRGHSGRTYRTSLGGVTAIAFIFPSARSRSRPGRANTEWTAYGEGLSRDIESVTNRGPTASSRTMCAALRSGRCAISAPVGIQEGGRPHHDDRRPHGFVGDCRTGWDMGKSCKRISAAVELDPLRHRVEGMKSPRNGAIPRLAHLANSQTDVCMWSATFRYCCHGPSGRR